VYRRKSKKRITEIKEFGVLELIMDLYEKSGCVFSPIPRHTYTPIPGYSHTAGTDGR
jgi:hypothetical protein